MGQKARSNLNQSRGFGMGSRKGCTASRTRGLTNPWGPRSGDAGDRRLPTPPLSSARHNLATLAALPLFDGIFPFLGQLVSGLVRAVAFVLDTLSGVTETIGRPMVESLEGAFRSGAARREALAEGRGAQQVLAEVHSRKAEIQEKRHARRLREAVEAAQQEPSTSSSSSAGEQHQHQHQQQQHARASMSPVESSSSSISATTGRSASEQVGLVVSAGPPPMSGPRLLANYQQGTHITLLGVGLFFSIQYGLRWRKQRQERVTRERAAAREVAKARLDRTRLRTLSALTNNRVLDQRVSEDEAETIRASILERATAVDSSLDELPGVAPAAAAGGSALSSASAPAAALGEECEDTVLDPTALPPASDADKEVLDEYRRFLQGAKYDGRRLWSVEDLRKGKYD
jgi:hypothetical protein